MAPNYLDFFHCVCGNALCWFSQYVCAYIYIYIYIAVVQVLLGLSQLEPCLPAIHSCCRSTAWSHLTPSICGFNAKRSGNKSEYFGIYLAKLLVLSDTPGIWKIQQKQWNIRKKIHAMEGFQIYIYIYNLEQCHARVSKYSILSVFIFLSLIKAQRIRLNNWKTMNNNDK